MVMAGPFDVSVDEITAYLELRIVNLSQRGDLISEERSDIPSIEGK